MVLGVKDVCADAHELAATRWHARPRLALVLRVFAALLPFACSVVVTRMVQRRLPAPDGLLSLLGTWAMLAVVGTAVLWAVEKLSRRLLPLAALLRMSLVFPDQAPSRFRSAIRTGTVAQLERRIENVQEEGLGNTPAEAARTLIDLLAALNRHDRLTRGHAERVRAYSRLIGEELGFDDDKLELLHWAALVHDIGKLVVPAEILQKPGTLTDEEFAIVRQHPAAGAAMVEPLADWLGDWRLAVLEHHERWDGQGYPNGLAGEEISLAGRIVAVADVFDVITSPRSYKSAISADDARREIARCSGTQFDPTVVRAFLNIGISRLRLLLGPLAWLSQVRFLGELPLAPIGAAATGAAAGMAAIVAPALSSAPDSFVEAAEASPAVAAEVAWGATPTTVFEPTTTTIAVSTTAPSTTSTTVAELEPVGIPSEPDVAPAPPAEVAPPGPKEMVPVPPPPPPPTTVPPTTAPPTTAPPTTLPPTTVPPTTVPPTTVPPTTVPPPPNALPQAADDVLALAVGTSATVDVLANDSDADGDALLVTGIDISGVDGGTVSFTPDGDLTFTATAAGTDTVGYEVQDGNGGTDRAVVTITVTAAGAPVLVKDVVTVVGGAPFNLAAPGVLANDSDPGGDALSVIGVTPQNATAAAAGTLAWAADGSFTFTPGPGFEGTAKWTYTVEDATGSTASTLIEITVTDNPFTGVLFLGPDDALTTTAPPVANPEPDPAGGDTLPGKTIAKGGADTSADADELQDEIDSDPSEFGVWTSGPLSADFEFDGPVGLELFSQFNDAGLVGNDVDYALWLQACNPASNNCETLVHVGPERVGPWNRGVGGWQRSDLSLGTVVDLRVRAGWQIRLVVAFDQEDVAIAMSGDRPSRLVFGPAAPVAYDDAGAAVEDDPEVVVDVLANDADINGDALSIQSVTAPTIGSTSIVAGGIRFVPPPNWSGTEVVDYVVADPSGATDVGTVTFTVAAAPDAPVATDDTFSSGLLGVSAGAPGLLANDSDADGDTLTVVGVTPASSPAGTLVVSPDGSFTFFPALLFIGTGTWTYTVDDGTGGQATATLTIDVL